MYQSLGRAATSPRRKRRTLKLSFGPWPRGLTTAKQAEQASNSELVGGLNIVLVEGGVGRTRDGSTLVCSGCTGSVLQAEDVLVGGQLETLIATDANKLYKADGAGGVLEIGTFEGPPRFTSFMDKVIIFDGSYLKEWDGTDVKLLFDDGTGDVEPYQFSHRFGDPTTSKDLDGTTTLLEYAFTTQDWTAGFTIPPTVAFAKMLKVGSPTGTVVAKVKKADGTVIATADFFTAVENFVTDAGGKEHEARFAEADITEEMAPGGAYKLALEYTGGDASNYVQVLYVDTDTPVAALRPSRPPKAASGDVFGGKLFTIGGEDSGRLWYCVAGNPYDWSSPNGGGWVGAIDDSAKNFAIGGIVEFFDNLYVFGTKEEPYLARLFGETPSDYKVRKVVPNVSGDFRSIVATPDNVWFLHPSGVDSLSAVQEHGDVAVSTQTDSVKPDIHKYFSEAAVAGYCPVWGLYCLKMEGTDEVYIIHTRLKAGRAQGQRAVSYSPVIKWKFAFPGAVTCFGKGSGAMYLGTDLGELYRMDKAVVQDHNQDADYSILTNSQGIDEGEAEARLVTINASGKFGAGFDVVFYRDFRRDPLAAFPFTMPIDTTIKTSELDMDTVEAGFPTNPELFVDRSEINFNFHTLQVGIENLKLYGKPLYVGAVKVRADAIGGF